MGRLADRTRSLGALVVAAACLPTLLTLALIACLHLGGEGRMRAELEQRATLIAAALAEASEYGLISGNPVTEDLILSAFDHTFPTHVQGFDRACGVSDGMGLVAVLADEIILLGRPVGIQVAIRVSDVRIVAVLIRRVMDCP